MVIFQSLTEADLVRMLRQGAVGVLPTDTIYGVVGCAADHNAAARLYSIKHREGKPGTVIAASTQQLLDLGLQLQHIDKVGYLWPNPISVVLPAGEQLAYLHQGRNSLAVRIPLDETLRALLEQTGPLLTSSANHPGQPPADTVEQAQAYFADNVDFYVDGGDVSGRSPSTVVRLATDGTLEMLRRGAGILPGR